MNYFELYNCVHRSSRTADRSFLELWGNSLLLLQSPVFSDLLVSIGNYIYTDINKEPAPDPAPYARPHPWLRPSHSAQQHLVKCIY